MQYWYCSNKIVAFRVRSKYWPGEMFHTRHDRTCCIRATSAFQPSLTYGSATNPVNGCKDPNHAQNVCRRKEPVSQNRSIWLGITLLLMARRYSKVKRAPLIFMFVPCTLTTNSCSSYQFSVGLCRFSIA